MTRPEDQNVLDTEDLRIEDENWQEEREWEDREKEWGSTSFGCGSLSRCDYED